MLHHKRKFLALVILCLALLVTSVAQAEPVHKEVFANYSVDNVLKHLGILAAKDNARETGTEGEHQAADYLADYFGSLGLNVERQRFDIRLFKDLGSELTIISPENKQFVTRTFNYSPSTPAGGLQAELVYAGLGRKNAVVDDFAGKDLTGKIAFIQRGEIRFYEKVQNAASAGAIGAIIFNNQDGIIAGTLVTPTDIPALAITKADGEYLLGLLNSGNTVTAHITVNTLIKEDYSENIIATKPATRGNGGTPKTFVVGAHYDSVDTPGANDNASGTATLLETTRLIADQDLAYDVKFVAFGAEEAGLIGSQKFTEDLEAKEQLGNVVAMINLDMVGVGDTLIINRAYDDPTIPTWIQTQFVATAQTLGMKYETDFSDLSDHASFEDYGIPTAFLTYRDDPYYHTDNDSLDKINSADLYNSGTIVTSVLYQLAKTPIPHSTNGLRAKSAKLHSIVKGEKLYFE